MRRLGTASLWLLVLCGLACGDRVVVARGLSLVSAARSSDDAGIGEAEPQDAAVDATDDAAPRTAADIDHGSTVRHPPTPPPAHNDQHGDTHDKAEQANTARDANGAADIGEQDAGHYSALKRH